MKKFVCLYKSGGDYTEKEVFTLFNQVKANIPVFDQFIVYTDEAYKFEGTEIIAKPLVSNLPKRWAMRELFREKGHVMVTGLDTLIVKDISWVFDVEIKPNEFYGMHAWTTEWGNNPMLWNGDWSYLFELYKDEPLPQFNRLEQRWTRNKLYYHMADVKYIDDRGLKLYSYKHHCQGGLPKDADMVIFHGKPRPHKLNNWVKHYYTKWNNQS